MNSIIRNKNKLPTFFINRFQENDPVKSVSYFSFLSQFEKNEMIVIDFYLDSDDKEYENVSTRYVYTFTSGHPEIIKIRLPKVLYKSRFSYRVSYRYQVIYEGSFVYIPTHKFDSISFSFVSSNADSDPWVWKDIQTRKYDIIIHNGGLIGANSAYDFFRKNTSDIRLLYIHVQDLVIQRYSHHYQGECMRNSWNFHMTHEKDYVDLIGINHKIDHLIDRIYFTTLRSIYAKYLMMYFPQEKIWNFHYHVNKRYQLIFLDTMSSLFYHETPFHDECVDYLKRTYDTQKTNIIVLPQHLSSLVDSFHSSKVAGYFDLSYRYSYWHPQFYDQTSKFYQELIKLVCDHYDSKCFIVSGNAPSMSFVHTHEKNENVFFEEMCTSISITQSRRDTWIKKLIHAFVCAYENARNFRNNHTQRYSHQSIQCIPNPSFGEIKGDHVFIHMSRNHDN